MNRCFAFLIEICETEDCRGGDCEIIRHPNAVIKKLCHCVKVNFNRFYFIRKFSFQRVFVVKHVSVFVMLVLNVKGIHVGLVVHVLILLI
jgi:hypothetical protein